ncbi:alcohol dehydrogenase catalytic domain-containing protein [Frankia sp. CNm7]|uniref:alcohol dehydrogenase n=1 Tax=Frankia nepalensis TaxID=1836974 RepID=A0A937RN87_9ACTN|nr:alcohol dehydrogenase catalytic domain-containing protein [Frankia nepalensis]MBL7502613.1 alcohol dehydrogenase catalytic domain-containing protein [Frankia nepalensis]MBL7514791.1 alcohol dehydrogenase catalytic domain-containing protein [Frankia nepalensis]MBL7522862.1 alcohol dehydrogenase catalytic domain-containing protein [Frankia nepalensis]MBL7629558.1 alcohol dehydrogenase catalytic domain-containing protein [Frankia nepalensis]
MRAVRVLPAGGLEVADVPVPAVGADEVLVKVAGAGLCHSDCMISKVPSVYRSDGQGFTIGHETAGWVEAVGPDVRGLSVGQPVVVHAEFGCGQCPTCVGGHERYCPAIKPAAGAGLGYDGGLAEFLRVPARTVVTLPDGLDPVDAGPLDDAGLTPYHAIRASMPWLGGGSVATVIGIGGLGHLAVQILRAVSPATIVAVEPDPRRREFALELGADLALDPADGAAAQVRALGGSSLVLDLVGVDDTLALAVACAAERGKVVCIGAGLGSTPFGLMRTPWECVLQTSYSGEAWELRELVALAAAGKVRVSASHITLDEVPAAYDRLDRAEQGVGRTIAIP